MREATAEDGALVTVVIAVHTAQRPLSRAVRSCLSPVLSGRVNVVVVCHNIDVGAIAANVADIPDAPITFLELHDGLRSPAGPKNLGLDHCRTPYVLVLDSDDYLEDGALAHWLEVLVETGSDGVIAPLKLQSGAIIRTPRARLLRRHGLDPVKDQLPYATAPRGLWSLRLLRSADFQYTPGLRTAEDLDPGLRLWFSGAKLAFPSDGPHYVLGEDAADRVTADLLSLAEEFEAVMALDQQWIESLTSRQRASIATKLVRIHLFGALLRRGPQWGWPEDDRDAVYALVERVRGISRTFGTPLTTAEKALLAGISDRKADSRHFQEALQEFADASYWQKLLGPGLVDNFGAESVLRHQLRLKAHAVLARISRFRARN